MNFEKLTEMTTPITKFKAINSSNKGLASKSEYFGGMENLIYIANECHITLTSSVYAKKGTCLN